MVHAIRHGLKKSKLVAPDRVTEYTKVISDDLQKEGFTVLSFLGAGSFGVVYHVMDVKMQEERAIKVLSVETHRKYKAAMTEAATLHYLYDKESQACIPHTICRLKSFKNDKYNLKYLVTPFVKGFPPRELYYKPLRFQLNLMKTMASALHHIHSTLHLIHNDIKPNNIRVDNDGNVTFLDWGLSCEEKNCHRSTAGSRGYRAPELYVDELPYDPYQKDVYALGVTFMAMMHPDQDVVREFKNTQPEMLSRTRQGLEQQFPELFNNKIGPKGLRGLLLRMCDPVSSSRITGKQAAQYVDVMIQKLL